MTERRNYESNAYVNSKIYDLSEEEMGLVTGGSGNVLKGPGRSITDSTSQMGPFFEVNSQIGNDPLFI